MEYTYLGTEKTNLLLLLFMVGSSAVRRSDRSIFFKPVILSGQTSVKIRQIDFTFNQNV